MHLDGARVFNALVETDEDPKKIGQCFDTASICLSKGLGAPIGSLLLSSSDYIKKARRVRKVMGGGMRQAGFMAAAGIYALSNHVGRLKEDHRHARAIAEVLSHCNHVNSVEPVDSNIIIFSVNNDVEVNDFLQQLHDLGILA